MKLAFVIDPIERFDIDADTSFAFMLEAFQRGHEVYELQMHEISAEGGRAFGNVQRCELQREAGDHVSLGQPEQVALDTMDVIFMRKDPPFDVPYLHACHLLELAEDRGSLVVNRPMGLRAANEKLFALRFEDVIPQTIVSRDLQRIRAFLDEQGGRCVVKPVDGHGGEGILVLEQDDRNLNAMLELSTKGGREYLICQQYLPAARQGDKRVILLDGEPLGGIMRIPQEDEHRGNMHVGGRVAKAELTARDLEICEAVAPRLRELGLWFVGLDVIGDYLTEVNVTSPTGIQEMSRLNEVDGAGLVVDFLEERAG